MAFPPSPRRPCQSVEPRPDVPVPSQAGSILREGLSQRTASIRRSVMSHTTCTLLGPFDPLSEIEIAAQLVTDTGFVMAACRTTSGN